MPSRGVLRVGTPVLASGAPTGRTDLLLRSGLGLPTFPWKLLYSQFADGDSCQRTKWSTKSRPRRPSGGGPRLGWQHTPVDQLVGEFARRHVVDDRQRPQVLGADREHLAVVVAALALDRRGVPGERAHLVGAELPAERLGVVAHLATSSTCCSPGRGTELFRWCCRPGAASAPVLAPEWTPRYRGHP